MVTCGFTELRGKPAGRGRDGRGSPNQVVAGVRTGTDLFKLLKLVLHKVKGDGSCWVYAIMACAGLCDHAHPRHNNDPSSRDRTRDSLCRVMTHTYLQKNGVMLSLSTSDLANLDDILEMPKYPMKDDDDFGSFGSSLTVLGLAFRNSHISGAEYGFISTTRENLTMIRRHGRYYDGQNGGAAHGGCRGDGECFWWRRT